MAMTLNGSNQYAYVNTNLSLSQTDPFWISMWLYTPDATPTGAPFNLAALASAPNHLRRVTGGSGGYNIGSTGAGVSNPTTAIGPVTVNQWQNVIASWGASGTFRDISLDNSTPTTNSTTINITVAPTQMRVGATMTLSTYFEGRIAFLSAFSGVPTSQDRIDVSGNGVITDALHPTLTDSAGSLIDWWDFNSSDLTLSGTGNNNLTLVNSPGSAASPDIIMSVDSNPILRGGWWL